MENQNVPAKSDGSQRGRRAESLLASLFAKAGWQVRHRPDGAPGHDLAVRRKGIEYAVEIKSAPEGRADRLVPLFAQAALQAARAAGKKTRPLAVVAAPKVSSRAAAQVMEFAEHYAPDAAAGVIDFEGFALFRGPHLDDLNARGRELPVVRQPAPESGHLFSDLNQWMLKVLLAPEVPDALLKAPRGQYRNASELARAANGPKVPGRSGSPSVMSAFRFVQQLLREGYLDEAAPYLRLVRREDLFRRWQASSARTAREVPARFALPGDAQRQVRVSLWNSKSACLALFAAADALGLGFVHGVPTYIYVDHVHPWTLGGWKFLRPCAPGEPPDVMLRQAPALQSVFRGMVRLGRLNACDVLQVWLDVAAHPSRGLEQADLIYKRVLRRVIEGGS